jgi:hypothetical protein
MNISSGLNVSDDDDDDFMVAYAAFEWMGSGSSGKKKEISSDIPVMSGIQWVEVTLQDPEECYNMLRMTRSVFLRLHDTLVKDYGFKPRRKMCTKEALGMFYGLVEHPNLLGKSRISLNTHWKLLVESLMKS